MFENVNDTHTRNGRESSRAQVCVVFHSLFVHARDHVCVWWKNLSVNAIAFKFKHITGFSHCSDVIAASFDGFVFVVAVFHSFSATVDVSTFCLVRRCLFHWMHLFDRATFVLFEQMWVQADIIQVSKSVRWTPIALVDENNVLFEQKAPALKRIALVWRERNEKGEKFEFYSNPLIENEVKIMTSMQFDHCSSLKLNVDATKIQFKYDQRFLNRFHFN